MSKIYAAIEAGGTKFNCALFDSNNVVLDSCRIPTTSPTKTLDEVGKFFTGGTKNKTICALGVASFGPLDLDKQSKRFGQITNTPKPGWSNTPLLQRLAKQMQCPVAIDTDVNGAALAEALWGAGKNKSIVAYLTIGTGIGGGVVVNGQPLHGLVHPEMGHMLIPGHPNAVSHCEFHKHCAEGVASGKSLGEIWQQPAETLEDEHPAWRVQAEILAQVCHNTLMCLSPHVLILGGGVMAKQGLLKSVVRQTEKNLNGYLTLPRNLSLSDIIVSPSLGDKSGLYGALALAKYHAQPFRFS